MEEKARAQLNEYNALFREMDFLYGEFARTSGLPEAAFWVLYTVREVGPCTQTMIYQRWAMGKQTINNEVKKLAAMGLLSLTISEKDRRTKLLSLTEKGLHFVRSHIDIVFKVEEKVFEELENGIGISRLREFHSHFSKIEYTTGGEKRHLTFEDTVYGPNFEPVAEMIIKKGCCPTVICESAGTQAEDAQTMMNIYKSLLNKA